MALSTAKAARQSPMIVRLGTDSVNPFRQQIYKTLLSVAPKPQKKDGLFLDRPGRREAAFSHSDGSKVRELTLREEHLVRRGGAKMKIWPIAVASLIFGWAILQDRRHSVRELYRAHDRRRYEKPR